MVYSDGILYSIRMTQPNRTPRLYITSELLEKARDERVTGATAHNSARELIDRASQDRLRGLSVSRLVLHTSGNVEDRGLKVYRVNTYENVPRFETSTRPATHPRDFLGDGLPEVHSLLVPVKEFDSTATAWSLHDAAARYADKLGLPAVGEPELRVPTEGFGHKGLDQTLDFALQGLGGITSRAQPEDRRESPESLSEELGNLLKPYIGRAADVFQAIQALPDNPNAAVAAQFMPNEMAPFVEQTPPIVFHQK